MTPAGDYPMQPSVWPPPVLPGPHRCPICDGKGTVPIGFYGGDVSGVYLGSLLMCRACEGKGIVWKP